MVKYEHKLIWLTTVWISQPSICLNAWNNCRMYDREFMNGCYLWFIDGSLLFKNNIIKLFHTFIDELKSFSMKFWVSVILSVSFYCDNSYMKIIKWVRLKSLQKWIRILLFAEHVLMLWMLERKLKNKPSLKRIKMWRFEISIDPIVFSLLNATFYF